MKKRGQSVSLFIILALVIIIGASFTYYLLSGGMAGATRFGLVTDQVLSQQTDIVKNLAEDCLEQKALEAKELFGLRDDSKPHIEEHIESYLADCLHGRLEGTGIIIEEGRIEASSDLSDYTLSLDITYPIKVVRGKNSQRFSKLNYYLSLNSGARLSLDGFSRTTSEYRILSHDGRVELIIPAGTRVTDSTGAALDEVSIRTADRNEGGLVNSVVMGMTVYDGLPDGARFDPAITIVMRYDPDELMGFPEKDLKIGWFDAAKGFWWGLPSSRVDTANRLVMAELSHFTKIGVVGCTPEDTGIESIEFSYKTVLSGESLVYDPCPNSGDGAPVLPDTSGTTASGTNMCLIQADKSPEYSAHFFCHNGEWYHELCDSQGCDGAANKCVAAQAGETTIEVQLEENGVVLPEPTEDSCACACEGNCRIVNEDTMGDIPLHHLGYFSFTIEPNGNGCIMEKSNGEADLKFEVLGSSGDTIGATDTEPGIVFNEGDTYTETETDPASELVAGQPINIFYNMENTNGDSCAWSIERVTVNGRGITYPEQCAAFSDTGKVTQATDSSETSGTTTDTSGQCTVQDAINVFCGKGDPVYNDAYPGAPNCEKDSKGNPIGFLDPARAPTLNLLIGEARLINPDRWRPLPLTMLSSNGQVLAKIQELGLTMTCDGVCQTTTPTTTTTTTSTTEPILNDFGTDPDASSTSTSCTDWEKSLTKEQLIELAKAKAREMGTAAGVPDPSKFAEYIAALTDHETGAKHCTDEGNVIGGDEGRSVGMFAIYLPVHQQNTACELYRLECNIQKGISIFLSNYKTCLQSGPKVYDCRAACEEVKSGSGLDVHKHSIADLDCSQEIETYEGYECALRYYQGWGCTYTYKDGTITYFGLGRDENYLNMVADFRRMYPELTSYGGSGTGITTTTCLDSATNLGSCQLNKGVLLDTVTECDSLGGWPIYDVTDESVTSGRKVCCRQEGCCVRASGLTASGITQCTGQQVASTSTTGGSDGSCGDKMIEIAESALGRPYLLGALSWSSFSVPALTAQADCSSYTKWVYDRYAYLYSDPRFNIPTRLASWQAANIGRVVDHDPLQDQANYEAIYPDCSKLQKGDLVFFYNTADVKQISHVGIYYGDCMMIHEGWPEPGDPNYDDPSTHKVQVVRLDSDLRKKYYIGAKRVCPDETASGGASDADTSDTDLAAFSELGAGTFEQKDCSEVTGCCVWDDNGCKKSPSTQKACGDKEFFPLENNCEKHPECEAGKLGYSGKCRYCGSNAAAAKQIDPGAACSGGCCEADCPSGTVIVPDVVYYNQCRSFGSLDPYCYHACGPTSLKMALEANSDNTYNVDTLWKGMGCYPGNCGDAQLSNYARSIGATTGLVGAPSKAYLKDQIDRGNSLVITSTITSYSSQGCATGGGHFLLLVGYADDYMVVNDPYSPDGECTGVENLQNLVITNDLFFSTLMTANSNVAIPITGGGTI